MLKFKEGFANNYQNYEERPSFGRSRVAKLHAGPNLHPPSESGVTAPCRPVPTRLANLGRNSPLWQPWSWCQTFPGMKCRCAMAVGGIPTTAFSSAKLRVIEATWLSFFSIYLFESGGLSGPSLISDSVIHAASRFFKIFFANGSLISLCLGTDSIAPVFGFIQSECEAPSRFK
jgi:hypothetical protein